jgi:hypothetical protein
MIGQLPSHYLASTDRRIPDPWGLAYRAHIRAPAIEPSADATNEALEVIVRAMAVATGLPVLEVPDMPDMVPHRPEGELDGLSMVVTTIHERVERYAEVTPDLIRAVLDELIVDGSRYFELVCHYEVHVGVVAVTVRAGMFIEKHRARQPEWRGASELVALAERHWLAAPFEAASALIGAATRVSPRAMLPLLDRIIAAPPGARRFLDPHPSWRVDGLRVRARKLRESARMWTEPEQPE